MFIDIIEKSKCHEKEAISQKGLNQYGGKFQKDDIIEFWGGYDNDIRYRAKVAGMIGDDIYIVWDCFWFPIQDGINRSIKKINK